MPCFILLRRMEENKPGCHKQAVNQCQRQLPTRTGDAMIERLNI